MSGVLIDVINHSAMLTPAACTNLVAALQIQVTRDFAPVWNTPAILSLVAPGAKPDPQKWWLTLLDDSDQAGALGYHEMTSAGMPIGKVFCKTTALDGGLPTVCASHELLEMLADPYIDRCVAYQTSNTVGRLYSLEVCLAGDTQILLADGSKPQIGEIASRGGWRARRTKRNANTVRVVMTDGSSVRCTPEHRFLLCDGSFVEAKHLQSGALLPAPVLADAIDRSEVHAIPLCQQFRGAHADTNLSYLRSGEFGASMALASPVAVSRHSPLYGSVLAVLSVGSSEQMARPDTDRRIASVADLEAGRDGSLVQFEGKSVGIDDLALITNLPIPRRALGASPQPTPFTIPSIRPGDPGPETLQERWLAEIVSLPTNLGAQSAIPVLPTPVCRTEPLSPHRADASFNRTSHAKVVDRVERDGQTDVFDMTVPKHHNFAIAPGVFVHNCDACEDDRYGYDINGVTVSDFVYPNWFEGWRGQHSAAQFDHVKQLKLPFELLPGGYISAMDFNGGGWQQLTGDMVHHAQLRAPIGSRRERRLLPRNFWRNSDLK